MSNNRDSVSANRQIYVAEYIQFWKNIVPYMTDTLIEITYVLHKHISMEQVGEIVI